MFRFRSLKKIPSFSSIMCMPVLAAFFISCVFISCASNNTGQADHVTSEYVPAQVEPAEESTDTADNGELDSIKLPQAVKPKSYFSKIDEQIVKNVELGSPQSLTTAMTALHKNEADCSESEKVLIYIATQLMTILWPSQKITWNVYETTEDTPYTAALNSVKKGIYDTSTGNKDFLSTFLPALVYLTPNITANVQVQCGQGLEASLKMNPDSVAANYLAGLYYEKNGKYDLAEPCLQKAYAASHATEIVLEYAKVLSRNGNYALAESIMKELGSGSTSSLAVLKQNAYIAFEKGDYTAAEEYVARVLQQTPNDLEFVLFRAKIFIEKNDYIHAVSLLDMYALAKDGALHAVSGDFT